MLQMLLLLQVFQMLRQDHLPQANPLPRMNLTNQTYLMNLWK
jgi:hypothetical protein